MHCTLDGPATQAVLRLKKMGNAETFLAERMPNLAQLLGEVNRPRRARQKVYVPTTDTSGQPLSDSQVAILRR